MIKKVSRPYSMLNPEPKRPLGYIPPLKPSFFGTASKRAYDFQRLSFDGVDDYVDAGNNASLNIVTNISYSLWVKFDSTVVSTNRWFKKGISEGQYEIYDNNGVMNTVIKTNINTYYTSIGTATLSLWYCIVVTYDGANIKGYLNGRLITTTPATGTIPTSGTGLTLGNAFNGSIEEVRIYNRALSESEITQLYNHIDPSRYGLVLEHNYRTGTATDFSGRGNHGTVYGAVYQ